MLLTRRTEQKIPSARHVAAAGLAVLAMLAPIVRAADDPPSPPPVVGETRVLADQFVRGQIAPPLALADGSAMLFQREGSELVLWRVRPTAPDKSERTPRPDVHIVFESAAGPRRVAAYASVETAAGHWLVGPTIALLRPDGRATVRQLPRPRSDVRALALRDGSVLVLGGDAWSADDPRASVHVERVTLQPDGTLSIEPWPDIPAKIDGTGAWAGLYDFSAIALRDGRVMVTGGEYRPATWLWQPRTRRWEVVEGVDKLRDRPVLVELADGRVWASGGSLTSGRDEMATTSSLWDPVTLRWSPGPDLPVPMKGHRAAWSADHRTVILGAGEHAALLTWTPGDPIVQIAAAPTMQRYVGALLPLPDGRVAVVSGRHALIYEEAWGRRSAGASLFEVATGTVSGRVRAGLWPQTREGAVAVRGDRLVAIGGRLAHAQMGSLDQDATRVVELQSLTSGHVWSLAPVPQPLKRAQAAWLDDHRVLVLGERAGDGPDGFLGVLDITGNLWQVLDAIAFDTRQLIDPKHGRTRLLGVDAKHAWLVSQDGTVTVIDSATLRREELPLPRRNRKRTSATGRVLPDGRLVIAGGEIDAGYLASRDESCTNNCEIRYIRLGARSPARTLDLWDPHTMTWTTSPRSRREGRYTVVLADGHVVMFGAETSFVPNPNHPDQPEVRTVMGFEVTDVAGGGWRSLPWPVGAAMPESAEGVERSILLRALEDNAWVVLHAAQGEDPVAAGALFLGMLMPVNDDTDWSRTNGNRMKWWWMRDAGMPGATWRELGVAEAPWRFPPGALSLGVEGADGKPMYAIGSGGGVVVGPMQK